MGASLHLGGSTEVELLGTMGRAQAASGPPEDSRMLTLRTMQGADRPTQTAREMLV